MDIKKQSPVPPKAQSPSGGEEKKVANTLFDFATAIKYLLEGKKISKEEWDNKKIYGVLKGEILVLHKEGTNYSWIISIGDLTGDDWFIIN